MLKEKIVDPETGQLIDHYIFADDEVAVFTGKAQGAVVLEDGTTVVVNEPWVAAADQDQANEISDKIGLKFVENGHPDDYDVLTDPDTEQAVVVQRPFTFTDSQGETHVSEIGTPIGEHPLDYQLGEHDDETAEAGNQAYRELVGTASPAAESASKNTKES